MVQVWYCVSPKDRAKFEAMARAQFPELYRCCPCFLRHKDILISPRVLRNHHIEYTMVRPDPAAEASFTILRLSMRCRHTAISIA